MSRDGAEHQQQNQFGYRIVTRQYVEELIYMPLPDDCKPLSCSLRAVGGSTGILCSFYDPESHQWVVRQSPIDKNHVRLFVTVVLLVDPENQYELHIAMTSIMDDVADNETLFELRRLSELYTRARHAFSVSEPTPPTSRRLDPNYSKGNAVVGGTWLPLEERPTERETVSLAAVLPTMEGYVICGGGFVSDYPVRSTGPAVPVCMDKMYDALLTEDPKRSSLVVDKVDISVATSTRDKGKSKTHHSNPAVADDNDEVPSRLEYSAWTVTAAANAGLACFVMGIRRNRRRIMLKHNITSDSMQHDISHAASHTRDIVIASRNSNRVLISPSKDDGDGLCNSQIPRSPSSTDSLDWDEEMEEPTTLAERIAAQTSPEDARREILSMMLQRKQITTQHNTKHGYSQIQLPLPHGVCTADYGLSSDLKSAACRFYNVPRKAVK